MADIEARYEFRIWDEILSETEHGWSTGPCRLNPQAERPTWCRGRLTDAMPKSAEIVTAQPLTTPTSEKEALREILREYPGYSRIVYVRLR
jgi:hypothetical protein